MNDDESLSYFEKRLTGELLEIERKIKELEHEKYALQRQLAKARAEKTGLQKVTRKNSIARVLAENAIFAEISRRGGEATSKQLLTAARTTNYDLKHATFRSYLHRMKLEGRIRTGNRTGTWRLPSP